MWALYQFKAIVCSLLIIFIIILPAMFVPKLITVAEQIYETATQEIPMGGIHQFNCASLFVSQLSASLRNTSPSEHCPGLLQVVISLATTRTRSLSSRTRRWRTTTVNPQDWGRTTEVPTRLMLRSQPDFCLTSWGSRRLVTGGLQQPHLGHQQPQ